MTNFPVITCTLCVYVTWLDEKRVDFDDRYQLSAAAAQTAEHQRLARVKECLVIDSGRGWTGSVDDRAERGVPEEGGAGEARTALGNPGTNTAGSYPAALLFFGFGGLVS